MNKEQQKERFLSNGISYEHIDEEMIDLIDVLNFKCGLKTQYCCYGHESGRKTYVIFDNSVNDEQIYELANYLIKSKFGYYMNFFKWVRGDGEKNRLLINWKLECNIKYDIEVFDIKKTYLDEFVKLLNSYK